MLFHVFVPLAGSSSWSWTTSPEMQAALFSLVAFLGITLTALCVFGVIVRRRSASVPQAQGQAAGEGAPPASALRDAMICPLCRREYQASHQFCPYDASRLVTARDMLATVKDQQRAAMACPRCRRTYDGGMRFCPHDGGDLVPLADAEVVCEHEHDHRHSAMAKICPACQGRYEYGAVFCGRDGMELVVLN